jgi:uncharacterized protein YjbI with pentapeptide repeats
MANEEHLAILKQGAEAWNRWRREHPGVRPDLSDVDLSGAYLVGLNFGGANLTGANLSAAFLVGAYFGEADLAGANLVGAQLGVADLSRANLDGADLQGVALVGTNLAAADLTGCHIYGLSAWNVKLEGAIQKDLLITRADEPPITVDDLEVAQFIYLLLHNEKIRRIIDTITSKVVLILGRFTPERKAVLDALREELRQRDYSPVVFDFDKPESKDLTETVQTLANMARFIIADLTDPSCIPHELAMVVPGTVVPVQPILLEGQPEYAMFMDLKRRYRWVLEPYRYASLERLLASFGEQVVAPAEAKARELRPAPSTAR